MVDSADNSPPHTTGPLPAAMAAQPPCPPGSGAAGHTPWQRAWARAGITALAYLLLGALSCVLSTAPVFVCPVYASAGLALAAVLTWGRAALPGVWLGSLALCLGALALGLPLVGSSLPLMLMISVGATLQAWLGAALVRRFVAQPLSLTQPLDIVKAAALGGLLACTVNASLGVSALWLSGTVSATTAWSAWLSWWLADTTGVLLVAPATLAFIGEPAADWRARRRTIAPLLAVSFLLLMVSTITFEQLQSQRSAALFERDVDRLTAAAHLRLRTPVLALRALQGAVMPAQTPPTGWLAHATGWWLSQPYGVKALGVAQRLPASVLDPDKRADSALPLAPAPPQVFDSDNGAARARDREVVVVQLVQTRPAEAAPTAAAAATAASAALAARAARASDTEPTSHPPRGLNLLSQPAARAAVLAARDSAEPAASISFAAPGAGPATETDLLVFQALYDGPATDAAAREQRFTGVAFATVSAQLALAGLQDAELGYLRWCLLEAETTATTAHRRRLAGPVGCEQSAPAVGVTPAGQGPLVKHQRLKVADQSLLLVVSAAPDLLPGAQSRSRWVVPVVGLLSAMMLSIFLLTITGHSRRTEQAVLERTAELRREVADRTLAQDALRAHEERMRVMVDNLPLGIALLDARGYLVECNPRLCGMLGQSAETLRGLPVTRCFEAVEEPRVQALRRALLNQRRTVDSVDSLKLRAANGRLTDVRVVASALYDSEGQIAHMVTVIEDMTAHHQLQDSELALNRAESANRAKSEFVSRMSHELRTPLNAMIGFAQLLALNEQPTLSPRQLQWAQQIQRAGWHLLAMINDTLDLARIESGATRLSLESVDLAPLLEACRDWVEVAAAQRRVVMSQSVAADTPPVLADATRLKQVLTNLLSNAVKYNREGGAVQVQARAAGEHQVEISVSDTGLGMSPEQLSDLFQPYNRLGRESSAIEGTGIGLVISRLLAELMGGTLQVRSTQGQGSTFTLTLPVSQSQRKLATPPAQAGPARYQQRLVHYVEDNPTNVEVMRGVLAQRRQITLQTSTLGLDGLSAIRHSRPDLILLDMQLPDISGLELLRHILKDDQIANIPVIVVSADATPQNIERALTLGAKHYVTKPLDIAAFLAMVDRTLAGNSVLG